MAGEDRWIAAEDAGRYRDALGVALPAGLPAAFLEERMRIGCRPVGSTATAGCRRRESETRYDYGATYTAANR